MHPAPIVPKARITPLPDRRAFARATEVSPAAATRDHSTLSMLRPGQLTTKHVNALLLDYRETLIELSRLAAEA